MAKINLKTVTEIKNDFKEKILKAETAEEQVVLTAEYAEAVAEVMTDQVKNEYARVGDTNDTAVLIANNLPVWTNEEMAFFNEVKKAGGFDTDVTFPETIIEKVFDNIQKDHPLLKLVNFTTTTGKVSIIRSRRTGVAVFGPLHKDLEGQLDAKFGTQEYTQLALTAFMLISNDTLDLGARWIGRYIQLCLTEAIADVWCEKIIKGTGKNEPVGLIRDLDELSGAGYAEKTAVGKITFKDVKTAVTELAGAMKKLSSYTVKVDGDDAGAEFQRDVNGKVHLLVNPSDYWEIVARFTTQNDAGVFVTNLPFIPTDHIHGIEEVPAGKLLFFVEGEYQATTSRPQQINEYKEVFAMKRATLYAVDMLANGQPTNNDAVAVYEFDATPS